MSGYTLTKHRGRYALSYRSGGRRVRISTGTADKGLAEARAGQIWAKLTTPASERVADLWTGYVRDRVADGVSESRLADNWKRIGPSFGHRIGTAITRADCRAYHHERKALGYSDSTVRTDMELLRACLRWRYGKEVKLHLWLPPASKPRERWLSKEEAAIIVEAAKSPHIRLFIVLGLTTGARASAILDLTWDRVNFETGIIDYQPAGREITNKRRSLVPMNSRAREALSEALEMRLTGNVIEFNGKPVKEVKRAIQRLSEATGIPFSPHVLRHTCGVWMANANVSMSRIAHFLNTTVQVAERVYARHSPAYMKDASEAVNW